MTRYWVGQSAQREAFSRSRRLSLAQFFEDGVDGTEEGGVGFNAGRLGSLKVQTENGQNYGHGGVRKF